MPNQYTGLPSALITRHCEYCGEPFTFYRSRLTKAKTRFCGHPCYTAGAKRRPAEPRFWRFVN
jgi:hypothetical protein